MIDQKQLDHALQALSDAQATNYQQVTLPCNIHDELAWLAAQRNPVQGYWRNREGTTHCYLGILHQATSLEQLEKLKQQFPHSRFYGGIAFDPQSPQWPGFAPIRFILPQFELIRDREGTRLIIHCELDGATRSEQLKKLKQEVLQLCTSVKLSKQRPTLENLTHRPDFALWQHNIEQAAQQRFRQDISKVVLARASCWQFDEPLDSLSLIARWQQLEPENYAFWMRYSPEHSFFGVPPERLYARDGRQFKSEALAGTCAIGSDAATTQINAEALLKDQKNVDENAIVAQAIHQQLTPLVNSQQTGELTIRRQSKVQHLCQLVTAELSDDCNDKALIQALHPTPAVCGQPKAEAYQFLREHEPFVRGWYAGAVGMVSALHSELSVAIRTARIAGNQLTSYAGAGIIPASAAPAEWQELNQKTAALQGLFNATPLL